MKIIADTHIWYYLGQDKTLLESVNQEPVCPTYLNIYELSKTENLIDKEDYTRSAMQMLFKFKKGVIFDTPFIYIAKLHQDYKFDSYSKNEFLFKFSEKFAKGFPIDAPKKEDFRSKLNKIRSNFIESTDFLNQEADKIKLRIDKKNHKKTNTIQMTAGIINKFVETTTNNEANIIGFDLNKIELLVLTLDHYIKTLETSNMKAQPNDWFDFGMLAYVQPGDKFWTREKRWKNLIKEVGCDRYLYE